ncbi:MAG TPA: LysR family transcriptional regulator [Candidatus Paceibacterota bacterium]|nr:LysR family transcriptional regulator [Verrucomicrobiota bacterium]HSA10906.1 LysR family transcriptional regulator [Candidatus Paceibacterota bacterium]
MQFETLKAFCDLAETGSFTRTAQINHVSQSAVSQTICALERHFNVLLLERGKKGFRLTAEGEVLYNCSREILQSYAALNSRLQEIRHVISGEIRISTVYSLGLHDLPPYVKRFMKQHPAVKIHVEYRRASQVYEDLLGNIVDLGLVAFPAQHPKLEIVPLRNEPLVLACHPQHPLARLARIRLKALNGVKVISFGPDMPTRKALDKIFNGERVEVQHVMEFDNIETVKRAVELDCGVALVPEVTIRQEIASQTLAAVPLEGNYLRPLAAMHRKTKVLSPAIKHFLALLKEPA